MGIIREDQCKHEVTKTSFVPRFTATWNQLPADVRNIASINQFKQTLKTWISENVPFD